MLTRSDRIAPIAGQALARQSLAQLSAFQLGCLEHYSESPNDVAAQNGMTFSDALDQKVQQAGDIVNRALGDIFHQELRIRANCVQEGLGCARVRDHLNCVTVAGD